MSVDLRLCLLECNYLRIRHYVDLDYELCAELSSDLYGFDTNIVPLLIKLQII